MGPVHRRTAVERRKLQIARQLERLRSQFVKKSPSHYATEEAYRRQLRRSHNIISDLEGELLILDCPGEYDELPAAVVADELGLTYEQVRSLIKLGEIASTGSPTHARICRAEIERIITAGVPALIQLSKEYPADIFERAIVGLQNGDLEAAKRAYRRLEARQSWRGPFAPALLAGLELAGGDLDGALSTVKLIYEHEDQLQRLAIMTYLGRLLRVIVPEENGLRELRDQLTILAEGTTTGGRRVETRSKQSRSTRLGELQRQAIYLTTSVASGLRKRHMRNGHATPDAQRQQQQLLDHEALQIIQDAIYTALYAEAFYDESSSSRIYADTLRAMIHKSYRPAHLLEGL